MNYRTVLMIIFSFFTTLSCKDKNGKDLLDFNDYPFNTNVDGEGSFNIGYVFSIDKKSYIEKEYDFIYYTKDLNERKLLIPGSLVNDEFSIYWREVNLPFKIIKRANSDTLVIIKTNKEFIFKRVRNSD
ncbi:MULTISPECIES: hypothetical protein [unclassified Chryseobacterium]|uniref:hypothetical protein n=1 Tax=unclassified Chryseobacterium TaxID=2593645 RepID=UPI001D7C38BE|nr:MULTISPECIES: hypothetical protein [unclassified Chryseobacterium]MCQ9633839.1 hypothetical protein [Chryseobacterium sp. WG23]CAH0173682.1 hypothetical protein SRABI04_01323 [Chryseobacterium sp. Bi04]